MVLGVFPHVLSDRETAADVSHMFWNLSIQSHRIALHCIAWHDSSMIRNLPLLSPPILEFFIM
jgi:hypothetical protein